MDRARSKVTGARIATGIPPRYLRIAAVRDPLDRALSALQEVLSHFPNKESRTRWNI